MGEGKREGKRELGLDQTCEKVREGKGRRERLREGDRRKEAPREEKAREASIVPALWRRTAPRIWSSSRLRKSTHSNAAEGRHPSLRRETRRTVRLREKA